MNTRSCRAALRAAVASSALLALAATSAPAADPVCGDVNQSGGVNTSDALLMLRKSVGQGVTLQCPVPSAPLRTGIATCYDTNGNVVSCGSTTSDGHFQKGVSRAFTDNGDGTITDLKTGLTWEKLCQDGGIHDADNVYTWADAPFFKIGDLNDASFAGHDDWRLPNLFELETLANLQSSGTVAVYPNFENNCTNGCTVFTCNCTGAQAYWSSTELAGSPTQAWFVYFWFGSASTLPKTGTARVRAVRGGL